jgi:uncharacterized protein (TIGR03083 family)
MRMTDHTTREGWISRIESVAGMVGALLSFHPTQRRDSTALRAGITGPRGATYGHSGGRMQSAARPEAMVRQFNTVGRAEVDAILATMRAGWDAAWSAPTACEGWVARDIVIHLIGATQFFLTMTRAVVEGTPPPALDPAQLEARQAALRQWSHDQLLSELQRSRAEYSSYLEGLSTEQLETPMEIFVTLPAWQFDGVLLNELVIHHWDLRAPQEPDARLRPEAVPLLVQVHRGDLTLLATGEKPDGTWQLDLAEPASGPVTIRAQGGQVAAQPGPASNPDARLALTPEAFLRLVWGRLDLAAAIDRGEVRVQGDRDRALALKQMFRGG